MPRTSGVRADPARQDSCVLSIPAKNSGSERPWAAVVMTNRGSSLIEVSTLSFKDWGPPPSLTPIPSKKAEVREEVCWPGLRCQASRDLRQQGLCCVCERERDRQLNTGFRLDPSEQAQIWEPPPPPLPLLPSPSVAPFTNPAPPAPCRAATSRVLSRGAGQAWTRVFLKGQGPAFSELFPNCI